MFGILTLTLAAILIVAGLIPPPAARRILRPRSRRRSTCARRNHDRTRQYRSGARAYRRRGHRVRQTNRYTGDGAIGVRLANQSEAKADASIQWQLREEDAEQMYLDYREFERIHTDLVDREFRASVNAVLARYNPLDAEAIAEGGIDLSAFADDIKKDMQKRMGKSVEVRSVALPIINYDQDTQRKIDQLQTEVANTRAAEQSKNTAREIAKANEILRRSLSDEVLSQRCIEAAEKVGAAPVGCIKGSNATPLVDMRKD